MNVTMRRKPTSCTPISDDNESNISVDDIIGNTLHNSLVHSTGHISNIQTQAIREPLTLEKISILLDIKLENIKSSIHQDIRNTIQGELNNTIKKLQFDMEHKTQNLFKEQKVITENRHKIDEKLKISSNNYII